MSVKLLLLNSAGRDLMVVELKLHGYEVPTRCATDPNAGNRQSFLLWTLPAQQLQPQRRSLQKQSQMCDMCGHERHCFQVKGRTPLDSAVRTQEFWRNRIGEQEALFAEAKKTIISASRILQ